MPAEVSGHVRLCSLRNARQHRLFIARDPMGIKPLYYAQSGSYFLFASEVRILLGTALVLRRIDPSASSTI
jgi:asparagine synthase (glutamine-hydrolysing)